MDSTQTLPAADEHQDNSIASVPGDTLQPEQPPTRTPQPPPPPPPPVEQQLEVLLEAVRAANRSHPSQQDTVNKLEGLLKSVRADPTLKLHFNQRRYLLNATLLVSSEECRAIQEARACRGNYKDTIKDVLFQRYPVLAEAYSTVKLLGESILKDVKFLEQKGCLTPTTGDNNNNDDNNNSRVLTDQVVDTVQRLSQGDISEDKAKIVADLMNCEAVRVLSEQERTLAERQRTLTEQQRTCTARENAIVERERAVVARENAMLEKERAIVARENAVLEQERGKNLTFVQDICESGHSNALESVFNSQSGSSTNSSSSALAKASISASVSTSTQLRRQLGSPTNSPTSGSVSNNKNQDRDDDDEEYDDNNNDHSQIHDKDEEEEYDNNNCEFHDDGEEEDYDNHNHHFQVRDEYEGDRDGSSQLLTVMDSRSDASNGRKDTAGKSSRFREGNGSLANRRGIEGLLIDSDTHSKHSSNNDTDAGSLSDDFDSDDENGSGTDRLMTKLKIRSARRRVRTDRALTELDSNRQGTAGVVEEDFESIGHYEDYDTSGPMFEVDEKTTVLEERNIPPTMMTTTKLAQQPFNTNEEYIDGDDSINDSSDEAATRDNGDDEEVIADRNRRIVAKKKSGSARVTGALTKGTQLPTYVTPTSAPTSIPNSISTVASVAKSTVTNQDVDVPQNEEETNGKKDCDSGLFTSSKNDVTISATNPATSPTNIATRPSTTDSIVQLTEKDKERSESSHASGETLSIKTLEVTEAKTSPASVSETSPASVSKPTTSRSVVKSTATATTIVLAKKAAADVGTESASSNGEGLDREDAGTHPSTPTPGPISLKDLPVALVLDKWKKKAMLIKEQKGEPAVAGVRFAHSPSLSRPARHWTKKRGNKLLPVISESADESADEAVDEPADGSADESTDGSADESQPPTHGLFVLGYKWIWLKEGEQLFMPGVSDKRKLLVKKKAGQQFLTIDLPQNSILSKDWTTARPEQFLINGNGKRVPYSFKFNKTYGPNKRRKMS